LIALLGLGAGMAGQAQVSFTLASSPAVGDLPRTLASVDVNGDGKPDILTPNGGADTVSVMTNNGFGGFVLSSSPATGPDPSAIAVGDFNRDGKMDAVVVNYFGNTLTVLTNDGSGGFATMATPAVGDHPQGITVADVNGDNWPDVIDANSSDHNLTVYTNNRAGGFGFSGNYLVGYVPVSVAAADLNGDGKPDLIAANQGDGTLTVLTNDGSGGFGGAPATYPAGNVVHFVIAADVNGDTNKDLICANNNDGGPGTITVLLNDGAGGFGSSTNYSVENGPMEVTAADFDGDGKVDLAVANRGSSSVSVLVNLGNGVFTNGTTVSVGAAPFGIAAADVDGDGKMDLVTANEDVSDIAILINGTPFPNSKPFVFAQPASQTVIQGGEVDLSVGARGFGPLTYQWLFNGKKIQGAKNADLSVTNIHPSQAGNYSVKVTSSGGSVTSAPAVITVINQKILVYGYSGNEKITTTGSEVSYGFSGELFFYPNTTNAIFVGWATINNKKQYWVSEVSDYLWIKVSGSSGRTYTILGKASSGYDLNGRPNFWSFLHKGQNTTLVTGTGKTFSFPNTFTFSNTQVYPNPQNGNMILREASSNYNFMQGATIVANDNGQTVYDLVSGVVASLVKQGYKLQ